MDSFIKTPPRRELTKAETIRMGLLSVLLGPLYLTMAWLRGGPGIGTHLACMAKGLRLTIKKPCKRHARWIYLPLDSTRYFEIPFACRHARGFQAWLDVSSPRQLPALVLSGNRSRSSSTMLTNPDPGDLNETREMADLLEIKCNTANTAVEALDEKLRFDLISCISVLEHVPDDTSALKKMWDMLTPGGRLVLTVPASAEGGTQMMDCDPYGLNRTAKGGFFFQRFYSSAQVRSFDIIAGRPIACEVWGERECGWLQANFEVKRQNVLYPVWREPYEVARNWKRFQTVEDLPGEGVFCAVYQKPM